MAKLSAHGATIGKVEYVGKVKAYCADGKVLKNDGSGWKLHGKLKAGVTPEQAFENAKARQAEHFRTRPAYAEYHRFICSLAGIGKRWKLISCLMMMPNDIDGIWSECCDGYGDNVHADVDDIARLCQLYRDAKAEADDIAAVQKAHSEFVAQNSL